MRLLLGKLILNIKSVYAPQTGRTTEEKNEFYTKLIADIAKVPISEMLIVSGDLNGHVGTKSDGFEGQIGRAHV